MILGRNIKVIRKKWRFNQTEFANLMNVKNVTISSYEVGQNDPKIPFLIQLQRLSGINIDDLYNRHIEISEVPDKPLVSLSKIPSPKSENVDMLDNYSNLKRKVKEMDKKLEEIIKFKHKMENIE